MHHVLQDITRGRSEQVAIHPENLLILPSSHVFSHEVFHYRI